MSREGARELLPHRIWDTLAAEDRFKAICRSLTPSAAEEESMDIVQVADALHWAGVAQRMLVALRDYFEDEPDSAHAAEWRMQLVALVGEDEFQALQGGGRVEGGSA